MISTGSVLHLDLCLRLRRLCVWDEGVGQAEGVSELTERERRSAKGYFGVGNWLGNIAVQSRMDLCSLSVSWRHLSKQPAVKV